ncbi:MAG: hypothetical protein WCP89_02520, partial [archaeon]
MKSTLKLLSLGIILLFLATSTINLVRSEGGSMTLVENVKSAIKDRQPIDTKLSEIYNKYHVSIAIVILGEAYNKDSAEATFRARRLDRDGIPTLNVLIYYGVENKKLFVVYSEERGYDKETADRITKAISEDISNKDLDTALLNSLSTLEIEIPKAIQRALQGGNDLLSKETCKSFYEGDKGDGKRLRFLFVGSGFSSEQDFKSFIEVAIDDGFKKIEPFKKYTGDGTNGKFQFLYSPAYDLKENGNGGYTGLEKQRQNCPNTVYTMLIDKNWDQQNYDGIYIGGTSLSSPQPNVVIHETGHHFGLNDEYLLSSSLHYDKAKIVNIAKYQKDWTNCAEDPKIWKDYLSPLSDNYSFKGCSLENLYRSSENSIMKGAAGSNKFNFL